MELAAEMNTVSQGSYRLRNVRFHRALVVEEDVQHQLYLFLNPAQGQRDTWFHFKISILRDDAWTEHCTGLVRLDSTTTSEGDNQELLVPLRYPSPAKAWYKAMHNVGFNFGVGFQNLVEIEAVAGQRTSRATIDVANITAKQGNASRYAIHPAIFDAFFQAGIPSLFQGQRTLIDMALVPRLIDEITVSPRANAAASAFAITKASFTTGRRDKTQNYTSDATVLDTATGCRIAEVKGLHYAEFDVPQSGELSNGVMTPMRVAWKPDILLLPEDADLDTLAASDHEALALRAGLRLPLAAAYLMSLLHHKVALPSVLDLDMAVDSPWEHSSEAGTDATSFGDPLSRFTRYVYAAAAADRVAAVQKALAAIPSAPVGFELYDPTDATANPPFDADVKFDFIVLRMESATESELSTALRSAQGLLSSEGHVVLVQDVARDTTAAYQRRLELLLRSTDLCLQATSTLEGGPDVYQLARTPATATTESHSPILNLPIVTLSPCPPSQACSAFLSSLRNAGWTGAVTCLFSAATLIPSQPLILLDDPDTPLLTNPSSSAWTHLRTLLRSGTRLIWLSPPSATTAINTSSDGNDGSNHNPSAGLIQGFARSLRSEDPSLQLTTLDLSSSSLPSCSAAKEVVRFLAGLDAQPKGESEFRLGEDGVVCVSRVVVDRGAEDDGDGKRERGRSTVRAWCERVGDLGSVGFWEVGEEEEGLGEGEVEVEVRAAGLNFKVCGAP
jgi:hypothetical protein